MILKIFLNAGNPSSIKGINNSTNICIYIYVFVLITISVRRSIFEILAFRIPTFYNSAVGMVLTPLLGQCYDQNCIFMRRCSQAENKSKVIKYIMCVPQHIPELMLTLNKYIYIYKAHDTAHMPLLTDTFYQVYKLASSKFLST